jgi:hypothetical protein
VANAQTPLWAPTPGVPLLARVLSYCFAGAMVLTIIASCGSWRPISLPSPPTAWKTFTSSHGYTIPYPSDWRAVDSTEYGGDDDLLTLDPGTPVQVLISPEELDAPAAGRRLANIEQQLAEGLDGSEFGVHDYQPTGVRGATGEHYFTGYIVDKHNEMPFRTRHVAVEGLWTVRGVGHTALVVIAFAPVQGWETMAGIVTHMLGALTTV